MKPQAKQLALAILTRVKECEGVANKTKLLKLLYLADIEHFRKHNETLTGFDWIFYLYGPWAAEYDSLLEELARTNAIEVENWSAGELSGARIRALESHDLNKLITNADEFYRIQHQVDTWADRSLPDLLNYVYFETEPMADAQSEKQLSFSNIEKEGPKLYRRASSKITSDTLRRLRAKLQAQQREIEAKRQKALRSFRQPVYDDVYSTALAELEGNGNQ